MTEIYCVTHLYPKHVVTVIILMKFTAINDNFVHFHYQDSQWESST